jgi:putative membrane protein
MTPEERTGRAAPIDPRVYFAAERTLLAWVRTGLALMGFGFVVARFGVFLREISAVQELPGRPPSALSQWVGTALVALGIVANVWAVARHRQTLVRLAQDRPLRQSWLSFGTVVALSVALIGALVWAYLVL